MKLRKFGIIFLALISAVTLSACNDVGNSSSKDPLSSKQVQNIYEDEYIKITRKGGVLIYQNLSDKGICLTGDSYLDDSYEIDDLPYASLDKGETKTQTMSTIDLEEAGKEGDEKFKTYWDTEEYKHKTKKGEKITFYGKVVDTDKGNDLKIVSFEFYY